MAAIVVAHQAVTRDEPVGRGDGSGEDSPADDLARLNGIPKALRERFEQAIGLPVLDKINSMNLADIEISEVEELVDALANPSDPGQVPLSMVRLCVMALLEDACDEDEANLLLGGFLETMKSDEDLTEETYFLTPEELHVGITQSIWGQRFQRHRRRKLKVVNDDDAIDVTREELVRRVVEVTDRHDAFLTLPMTIIYVLVFIYLVMGHLRIYDRQLLENAMEQYVNGRDPRETAYENVDDMDSWWEWVLNAGITGPLGKVKRSSDGNYYPWCMLASRNILLGDIQVAYRKFDGTEAKQWVLHTTAAMEYIANNAWSETIYQDAANASIHALLDTGTWNTTDIEMVYLSFNTYNEFARMFAMTEVRVPLKESGDTAAIIDTAALSVQAYPQFELIVFDVVYLLLVLYIGFGETRDAINALRLGCGEFLDYFQFWNIVDWFNIVFSIFTMLLWLSVTLAMNSQVLNDMINTDFAPQMDIMELTPAQLDKIDSSLWTLRILYSMLTFTMALNTSSVVMKFFKAFQSNPRLRVVTDTFKVAMIDFVHFFIIFTTIFLPFTIIGHVLFGNDVQQFSSVLSSVNTGFVVLMGDFGWYVDLFNGPVVLSTTLPSGMPAIVVFLWYTAYMFLVLLVLLNMLLAVILEHYNSVASGVQKQIEKPTLWEQARKYWQFRRQTKKFISLEELRRQLEDDEDPAHGGDDVDQESLRKAFPAMSEDQAKWIMDHMTWFLEQKREKRKNGAEKLGHLAELNKEKISELTKVVMSNKSRMDELMGMMHALGSTGDGSMLPKERSFMGQLALSSPALDGVSKTLEDLVGSMGKVRRDQERLARRMEELSAAVPQDPKLVALTGGKANEAPDDPDDATPPAKPYRGKGSNQSADSRRRDRRRDRPDVPLTSARD